jgi:hypothetical protein
MKNFDYNFDGPKNQLKERSGFVQWFSFSFETGVEDGRLMFVSAHWWMLGFQIFEFSMYRKKD